MAIKRYLAMTAAEIAGNPALPSEIAWMACQFSPYSTGLSNLPAALPQDSLLILNDFTPIQGHDPSVVGAQLRQCVDTLKCCGLLLDFQRPDVEETAELTAFLANALPCPVIVSEHYAKGLECPVFLSPLPQHVSLSEYLAPWQGRDIWLDIAPDGETITLSEEKAAIAPLSPGELCEGGHLEEKLHCHYKAELMEDSARFTLWRTAEDLDALLEDAEGLGVTAAVGLYQEIG